MLDELPPPQENVALHARATASERQEPFAPELAIDGDPNTRWSGIPGHNEGVWFELDWEAPVDVGCVVIHQFDRFAMEWDVEAWDAAAASWKRIGGPRGHFGVAGRRLPRVVIARSEPATRTTKLRIAQITNGPSFNEVEVFADPSAVPPEVHLAGDADGHILGVVTDRYGSAPVANAVVRLDARWRRTAWTTTVDCDEHGIFSVAAPLDLQERGRVHVATPGTPEDHPFVEVGSFESKDLPLALTPFDAATPSVEIGGPWRFAADPEASANGTPAWAKPEFDDSSWLAAPVPSHLVMHGLEPANGIAAGRRRFVRPSFPAGSRAKLRFDGVYSGAEVFLNGERCAGHVGGATPFEADVTELLRDGDNLLAVRMREHTEASDLLDRMSQYADFPLLGIWRDVKLFAVPSAHVAALAVTTSRVEGTRDATLDLRVSVANERDEPLAGELAVALAGPDGRSETLSISRVELRAGPWSRVDAKLAARVAAPAWWDAEHPNLHVLTLELRRDGAAVQRLSQRVGFRETSIRGSELCINGAPVKFRGTCHHDGRPLTGRVVTAADEREDAELIRGANLNALRTSHYPPHPALLDAADELGLYVEDEASFCWVGDSDDLRLAPRILQLTAELVARDRNHPSVFLWSLCNESGFGWGFERSHDWIRAADPSRPTGAAISADLEIATRHNPITLESMAEQEGRDRPLLWDESFCIFQGIWGDVGELRLDPGIRDSWVRPMQPIAEAFFASKVTQGSMIWCFADDLACVPGRGLEYGRNTTRSHFVEPAYRFAGRGIVGDAPWGFVDGWRRKKPECFHVKELFAPVRVLTTKLPTPSAGQPLRIEVENRFDHTDLSELHVEWTLRGETRTAMLAAPPRSRAFFEIPSEFDSSGVVRLRFTDPRGCVVAERDVELVGGVPVPPVGIVGMSAPFRIVDEGTLSGSSVRILGEDLELAFDRHTGALRRAVAGAAPVLLDWAAPHLLIAGAPEAPRPGPIPTRLDALEITPAGGGDARVVVRGAWGEFEGSIESDVLRCGTIAVRADLVWHGPPVDTRELGLALSLPVDATHLEWTRAPDWPGALYPVDHLGRPSGEADAFPAALPPELRFGGGVLRAPPSWPFALDPSPMGCNDFRSTKRDVTSASLTDARGAGVAIEPYATPVHLRANVASDRVRLHVLDFSGGSAAGLWEWEHNYGRGRRLRDGDRFEMRMSLRLLAPRPRPDGSR